MKAIYLVTTLLLLFSTYVSAADTNCKFNLQKSVKTLHGTNVNYADQQQFLVEQDSQYTFYGDNNEIFVADRSIVTVAGQKNHIVLSGKASATITNNSNAVTYTDGSVTIWTNEDDQHQKTICNPLYVQLNDISDTSFSAQKTSTGEGLKTSAKVIMGIGSKTQDISNQMMSYIPIDPADSMIGSWQVISINSEQKKHKARGRINLETDGTGVQNYSIELGELSIPQLGFFQWERQDNIIKVIAENQKSQWTLLTDEANEKELKLIINDLHLVLSLTRVDQK